MYRTQAERQAIAEARLSVALHAQQWGRATRPRGRAYFWFIRHARKIRIAAITLSMLIGYGAFAYVVYLWFQVGGA